MLGLILTGSFARGEGTIVAEKDGNARWLSDVECLAVHKSGSRSQSERIEQAVQTLQERHNQEPGSRKRGVKLEVSAMPLETLRRIRASIFRHELFEHGKLLWGEAARLDVLRGFSEQGIPRPDAFRLLNNRVIESLDARVRLESNSEQAVRAAGYAICKLWLDLATSLSVFRGCYRSSYRAREASLQQVLASQDDVFDRKFKQVLSEKVHEATQAKFGNRPIATSGIEWSFAQAADAAAYAWQWESAQLLGDAPSEDWRWVFKRLRRLEPARQCARDWARLLIRPDRRCYRKVRIIAGAVRHGSFANVIYGSGYLLNLFWDRIAQGGPEAAEITGTVGKLLNVTTQQNPGRELRRELATAVIEAWERHLRFAAA